MLIDQIGQDLLLLLLIVLQSKPSSIDHDGKVYIVCMYIYVCKAVCWPINSSSCWLIADLRHAVILLLISRRKRSTVRADLFSRGS
jgi:hypothetical protein